MDRFSVFPCVSGKAATGGLLRLPVDGRPGRAAVMEVNSMGTGLAGGYIPAAQELSGKVIGPVGYVEWDSTENRDQTTGLVRPPSRHRLTGTDRPAYQPVS